MEHPAFWHRRAVARYRFWGWGFHHGGSRWNHPHFAHWRALEKENFRDRAAVASNRVRQPRICRSGLERRGDYFKRWGAMEDAQDRDSNAVEQYYVPRLRVYGNRQRR